MHSETHPTDQPARLSQAKLALLQQRLRGNRPGERIVDEPIGKRPDGPVPLSPAQQRLWLLYRLEPDSPGYNYSTALRLQGRLDIRALDACIQEIVRRHEILRTRFVETHDETRQIVVPEMRVTLDIRDLGDLPAERREAEAIRLAQEESARPFDLNQGPALRANLLRLGGNPDDESFALSFTVHHIAYDGWSAGVLLKEFIALYTAFVEGKPSPLPELPLQYADFACWQRRELQGPKSVRQLAYWKAQLEGLPPRLELPSDRPRPPTRSFAGAIYGFKVPNDVAGPLHELGRRRGATLFAVLLAAFETLLHRYSGQRDFAVGVPAAGRVRPELEELIGFFVNTLVLRAKIDNSQSFQDFIAAVQDTALKAQEHQDLPFDRLVEELHPQRDPSFNPLFQTMFVLHNAPLSGLALPGLRMDRLSLDYGISKFDLALHATEERDGLDAAFEYSSELYEPERIARMAEHLVQILRTVGDAPAIRLGEISLPTPPERDALARWNATAKALPSSSALHAAFERQAAIRPSALAVACGDTHLTYRELNRRANRLAHWLRARGVGPEVPVGLRMPRSAEAIVATLGILKAGGAYVPIDPSSPPERVGETLTDCGASILLTERTLGTTALEAEDFIRFDPGQEDAELASCPDTDPALDHGADNAAYIIYTSGSTGHPKGVRIGHRNALASTAARADYYSEPVEGFLLLSPFAFDSSVAGIFWTLSQGGRLVVPREGEHQDMRRLIRLTEENGLTHSLCLPSLYAALLEEPEAGRMGASLRTAILAGEACPAELCARHFALLPDTKLYNEYGPTEAAVWASVERIDEGAAAVGIGHPVANVQIHVLDACMNPLPVGVPGEIYIGGPQVAQGYHRRPEATATGFVPDPFAAESGQRLYKTGDLACRRADGGLTFLGRIDRQVKVRGYRIELEEIETVLRRHPAVAEAAVAAQENGPGDKRLVAYVVPRPASRVDGDMLREFLSAALPAYMIPAAFAALDALPLTASGKPDRKSLPAFDFDRRAEPAETEAPRTPAEALLAKIWREVLRIESVGIHDNFFALGGDSIQVIQVCGRARAAGLEFLPRLLFRHQTVAELAAAANFAETAETEQGPVSGPARLTPAQRWLLEQNLPNPDRWNQALLLEVRDGADAETAERGLHLLLAHHDGLRQRIYREAGEWQTIGLPEESERIFDRFDFGSLDEAEQEDRIESEIERCQNSLNLRAGPLLRAAWFSLGARRNPRLLLVVHHLAVDGVSWRILLEDLQTVCRQMPAGQPPALPRKTSSFKEWSWRLDEWAQSEEAQAEAAYWLASTEESAPPLPVDLPDGGNEESHAAQSIQELSEAETEALLREAPAAYRSEIDDLLLAALAQTLTAWSGNRTVLIDVEGHGREDAFDGIDLSRTVGWFTSLSPLRLDLPAGRDPGGAIKTVKERRRQVPRKGIGYGALRYLNRGEIGQRLRARPNPQVLFNYLGQVDAGLPGDAPFVLASQEVGGSRAAENPRPHELEIDARISGGRLKMVWRYSRARYRSATVADLARNCLLRLRALLMHCLSPEAGGFTPSDFPLARLDQDTLDRLGLDPRNTDSLYPLSPLQQGLLLQSWKAPKAGVYILQLSCELEGSLHRADFVRAWQSILDANPILRTAFLWDGLETPLQAVMRELEAPVEYLDWERMPVAEQERGWQERLVAERALGFDAKRAPLLRLLLVRRSERSHYFAWTYHHALMDGWCLNQVLQDVFGVYASLRRRRPVRLAARRPYRDYIAWLENRDAAADERYWREQLRGFSAPTPLAADAGLPPDDPEGGWDEVRLTLSESDAAALEAMARRYRLTLNTLVQGLWAALLGSVGGERDVLFGVTVSGRPPELEGAERMVGLFINTLPLRVEIDRRRPLVEWLQDLQDRNAELRQHEHTPLSDIHGWSEVPRDRPLFESLLVFENYPVGQTPEADACGLAVRDATFSERADYPLTLTVCPGTALEFRLEYDRSRFCRTAVERLLGYVQTLARTFADKPDIRLGNLSLPTADERRQILEEWNSAGTLYPQDTCWHALFQAQAARSPDAAAAACAGETLTYAQLNRRANRLAHGLRSAGIGPESLVALLADRDLNLLTMIVGTLKTGAAYLPLDPHAPPARLAQLLETGGPEAVLGGPGYGAAVTEIVASASRSTADAAPMAFDFDALLEISDNEENPPLVGEAGNLAYVIFTSGSTGTPKAAMVEHRGLLNNIRSKLETLELDAGAVVAQTASQCFDISVWQFLTAPVCGGRVEIFPDAAASDPQRLLAATDETGVTVLEIVPSLMKGVLDSPRPPNALANLRWLLPTGEALAPDVARRWFETFPAVPLLNAYGPAECSDDVAYHLLRESPSAERGASVPIGRPIDNLRLYVLNAALEPQPAGIVGELCIGGVGVGRGYLRDPARTAAAFVPDPFAREPGARLYRSGDLGRFRTDGTIEFLGRLDHQVKLRGYRIEPGEIEAVLRRHPKVNDAAVVLQTYAPDDRRLVAYVACGDDGVAEESLRERIRSSLPAYMMPAAFVRLSALPLNRNGKLDRSRLPLPDPTAGGEEAAPRTPTEVVIGSLFAQTLNVRRVGIHDSFFDLGGHSLQAFQLTQSLRQRFDPELPLSAIFQAPTVARMARWIEAKTGQEESTIVTLREGSELPPLYCIHPGGGSAIRYRPLAEAMPPGRAVLGVQSRSLFDPARSGGSIDDMAEDYARQIAARSPDEPCCLIGWLSGGLVALATAAKLERLGMTVAFLGLLDTELPDAAGEDDRRESIPECAERMLAFYAPGAEPRWEAGERARLEALSPAATAEERYCRAWRWGVERGHWPESTEELVKLFYAESTQELRMRQAFVPPRVQTPIHVWRSPGTSGDWSRYSEGGARHETVEATPRDIVDRPQVLESIARALKMPPPAPPVPVPAALATDGPTEESQDPTLRFETLIDAVEHWAARQPEARAYVFLDSQDEEKQVLAYGDLRCKALRLADRLRQAGFDSGVCALLFPAGVEFVVAFVACLYAGLTPTAIPLPKKNRSNAKLVEILRSATPELALMDEKTLKTLDEIRRNEAEWPADIAYLALDGEGEGEPPAPRALPEASSVAFLQFTSGSTSQPKGVTIAHRNCLANLRMIAAVDRPGPSSTFVSWLPHYHDLGLVAHILISLYGGSTCALLAPETFTSRPVSWLRAIGRYRAQYTGAPNFAFDLCVARIGPEDKAGLDLSSLRLVMNGAEPISPRTLTEFAEYFADAGFESAMFLPAYGMAEATVFISAGDVGTGPKLLELDRDRLLSQRRAVPAGGGTGTKTLAGCGRGRLGQDIRIVEPDARRALPPMQIGEIWVAGPNVMAGYYRNEIATEEAFARLPGTASRYLRTGDLGFVDESGELYIAGRLKDIVILNGANYYPQDIETVLERAHPDVRTGGALAFGLPDETDETEILSAAVELSRQGMAALRRDPDYLTRLAQSLCTAVGKQLEINLGKLIVLGFGELPKTSSGKLQRQDFKKSYLNGTVDALATWPDAASQASAEDGAVSKLERTLQRVNERGFMHLKAFSELVKILNEKHRLGMADIDIDKSIFYYGIDSIGMLDIHVSLEKSLGRSIPVEALFHADSLLGMLDDIVAGLTDEKRDRAGNANLDKLDRIVAEAVDTLSRRIDAQKAIACAGRDILLTGATGYLGIHLLADLLQASDRKIYCLVRADNEMAGLERVWNNAKQNHVDLPFQAMDRLSIVTGDVSKRQFGLSDAAYAELSRSIAGIYHCAAIDNFHLPYEMLKDINVNGTIEVARLALENGIKSVYYISSCSAALLDGAGDGLEKGGLVTGYAQTKYVSEQIVLGLIERGLPWVNYRLGLLYSLHVDEIEPGMSFEALLAKVRSAFLRFGIPAPSGDVFAYGDNFGNFMKMIPKLGCMPQIDADIDLLPVEYASRAIVRTSLAAVGQRLSNYTFYNPTSLKWRDVAEYYRERCQIRDVPLPEFLEEFDRWARECGHKPIKLMVPILSHRLEQQVNRMYRDSHPDFVAELETFCPPCDRNFAHQYVNYLLHGFEA